MILYRAFAEMAHAAEFLSGRIRFGHLNQYRTIERGSGARGDASEGYAIHREFRQNRTAVVLQGGVGTEVASPGEVTVRAEAGNEVFVCCLLAPPNDECWARVRQELGSVVVTISDADRLRAEIQAAVNVSDDPWLRRAAVTLWPVEYTKGGLLSEQRGSALYDPLKRSITQKPPRYSWQHESRIALISYGIREESGEPPRYIYVTLAEPISYASITSVELAGS